MAEPFTHTFKYEPDGEFIRGEVEFNKDGITTFKMDEWSIPLTLDSLEDFVELMRKTHDIYESTRGIQKIIIKEKA